MCGIAGVYRAVGRDDHTDLVRGMLRCMEQRGPDGEGLFAEGPVTLGHRRLAILDLTDKAAQPMVSGSGRLVVTFNGEIYNFRELAAEMSLDPGSLRSESDTEVLLHAWERWGPDTLDRLVGQWAIAMYDRESETLWLARDRFGEKPLYYHVDPNALTFASTIPSLLQAPWISKEIDPEQMSEYLTLRYVVSPRSILRDVRKVEPGHIMTHSRSVREDRRWFAPRFRKPAYPDTARGRREAVEAFGGKLAQASRRCLVSDVPVGLLLSDGIDSNGIHAALLEAGADVSTYTYRARTERTEDGNGGPAESKAEKSRRRVEATYAELSRSLVPAFGSMTEPVGDGAVMATYLLIRDARPQATVFLCGHGGDELLGGYRLSQERFRLAAMRRLCRLPVRSLDRMVAGYTNGMEHIAARRAAIIHAPPGDVPARARYLVQRPLPYEDLAALFAPSAVPGAYLGVVDRLYRECHPSGTDLDRIQEVMLRTFLSENLLSLADSVSMASSAELRLPYLDRDLADLVFHLPPAMRVSPWPGLANTKRILRWWAKKRVPEDVLKRRKRGFRFGNIRALLAAPGNTVRERVVESPLLRRHLPGLDAWTDLPVETFRRGREATYWSLLTLAVWADANGIS